MDSKATVFMTAESVHSGTVEITCDNPDGWNFEITPYDDEGRDAIKIRITSPVEAVPPQFGVFFAVSGAGTQNVWISDSGRDGCHLWPRLWWNWLTKYNSQLAHDTPIAVAFNSAEESTVAIACSEAFNDLLFGLYADEKDCELFCRCEFFTKPVAAMREYEATVLLDRRCKKWYDTVKDCSLWIAQKNGFVSADVPDAAYDPLYSTWYAYLQDVNAAPLEKEACLAAEVGMKTMILDDGWQKDKSIGFYSATGDWQPVKSRFPDMKAHVDAVHAAGLKYMLWLAVPFMGEESNAWKLFEKKLLNVGGNTPGRTGTLDPRFPEVREYLINTYKRVIGEWGFDGVKLDFIDAFALPEHDLALDDNYAGRDYRSLPAAVDRLMKDVLAALKQIKPDVLIEFRQHYMGPAILQYGNMIRAADCPADPCANRKRICDLRLTSGKTAVHSDMLVWSKDETPAGAALPILNALFSTIQYSMVLDTVEPSHKDVIRHWLKFSQEHRETLLKSDFRPHHPELVYPLIEAESSKERIIVSYLSDFCIAEGAFDRDVYFINATGRAGIVADISANATVDIFDVLGNHIDTITVRDGLTRIPVPESGYAFLHK